ncbi:acyl-CoA thioesterase [Opitutaceae bacterium TAV5]|nr:acyl-CoA thioesterase [Opitutaceae bacterium TAV5]
MIFALAATPFGLAASASPTVPAATNAAVPEPALRDLKEVFPRNGIPRVLRKLEAGQSLRVAYLGGSITAQKGWRVQSLDWLRRQYPQARIDEIRATVGGTGSELGVFRLRSDVLDKKPDLLFVEFAVNDGKARPSDIHKSIEGIVRQTWRTVPDCDIVFIYTVTGSHVRRLRIGKMEPAASAMEDVADHYGIPSIHFGVEIARLLQEGKLVMSSSGARVERVSGEELDMTTPLPTDEQGRIVFSRDGVHPYLDTGHMLYTRTFVRAMEPIRAVRATAPLAATPRTLRDPFDAGNWEKATAVPLGSSPALQVDGSFSVSKDGVIWRLEPGTTLRFRFRGTKVAFYDYLGPNSGMIEVSLDGEKRTVTRFDGYCTYRRQHMVVVGDNLPPGEHEVTVTVLADQVDKRNILFARNREDFDKNPAKYEGNIWHVRSVLLIGELIE